MINRRVAYHLQSPALYSLLIGKNEKKWKKIEKKKKKTEKSRKAVLCLYVAVFLLVWFPSIIYAQDIKKWKWGGKTKKTVIWN